MSLQGLWELVSSGGVRVTFVEQLIGKLNIIHGFKDSTNDCHLIIKSLLFILSNYPPIILYY